MLLYVTNKNKNYKTPHLTYTMKENLMEEIIKKDEYHNYDQKFALSNDFIRMPNRLSAPALKTFYLFLTKIEWNKLNTKNEYGEIVINTSINEIRKAIGSSSRDYRYYLEFLDELQTKAWIKIDKELYYQKSLVMPNIKIWNQQEIEVTLNKELYLFFEALYKNFTVLELANISKFRSRYAIILYANLCSHMDHSKDREDPLSETVWRYTTRQLKEMFDISKEEYVYNNNFHRALFERRVIGTAVHEINNSNSGIFIRWRKIKDGKRVRFYEFHYVRTDVVEEIDGWNY